MYFSNFGIASLSKHLISRLILRTLSTACLTVVNILKEIFSHLLSCLQSLKFIQFVKFLWVMISDKGAGFELGTVEYTKCNVKITLTRSLSPLLYCDFFPPENMSCSQAILPLLHPALPPIHPHPLRQLPLIVHPPHHGGVLTIMIIQFKHIFAQYHGTRMCMATFNITLLITLILYAYR